jgi:hypothetical protein
MMSKKLSAGKLGNGITSPNAGLYILVKSGMQLTEPIFKIDFKDPSAIDIGPIANFNVINGQLYGIYQSSTTGLLCNYSLILRFVILSNY